MTSPSDIAGLSERLRAQVTSDHVRGCEGRNYSCDCGYDLSTEGLLDLAATALDSLTARVKELEDHNRRLGQGSAERYWEDRYRDEAAALARSEQQRDEAYRAAETVITSWWAENHPSAMNRNSELERAIAEILTAIRRLASGPEGGSEGEK